MCFGLPFDSEGQIFPMTSEDNTLIDNHLKWYQRRLQEDILIDSKARAKAMAAAKKPKEPQKPEVVKSSPVPAMDVSTPLTSSSKVGDKVQVPSPIDILLGRSKFCQGYIGNARYLHFIEDHAERYEETPKNLKTKVACELVELIKSTGSRFLKECGDGSWIIVDDKIAREKVSNAFRDKRKRVGEKKPASKPKPKTKKVSRKKISPGGRGDDEVSTVSEDPPHEHLKRPRNDNVCAKNDTIPEEQILQMDEEDWAFDGSASEDPFLLMGEITSADWIVSPESSSNTK